VLIEIGFVWLRRNARMLDAANRIVRVARTNQLVKRPTIKGWAPPSPGRGCETPGRFPCVSIVLTDGTLSVAAAGRAGVVSSLT